MTKGSYQAARWMVLSGFILVAITSVAWACSPQTRLYGITPAVARPHGAVKMTGESVTPGTPVEIRWNGSKGAVLGEAVADASGRFSTVVNIPDVKPDVYYLTAVAEQTGIARIALEVTAPAGDPANAASLTAGSVAKGVGADLWNGFSSEQMPPQTDSSSTHTPRGSNWGLAAGLALVGVGAAGMVTGLGLTAKRRQVSPLG